MATRAKFECIAIEKQKGWTDGKAGIVYSAKLNAVYGADTPENAAFFASTPNGRIELTTIRQDHFEVGKFYFVDFSDVP